MQNSSGWSNGDGKSGLKSYLLVHQLGPCCNFLGAIWEITTLGYSNALKDILSYQKMPWGQPKTRETHGLVFNTDDLVLVAQLCLTLYNSMDPLSMEFSGQEYWSRLPLPSLGESSWPRDQTQVSCIAGGFFTVWATREASWSLHKTAEAPIPWDASSLLLLLPAVSLAAGAHPSWVDLLHPLICSSAAQNNIFITLIFEHLFHV